MSLKTIAAVGLVVTLVMAGVAAAYVAGIGPAPGSTDEDPLDDFPTETPHATDAGTSTAGGATATAAPSFTFAIGSIEECGQTCRDVTVALQNQQAEPASDVTVYTRIYAGEDNTAEDDVVWSGKEAVGTIEADTTHTATRRVELSLAEALEIENNGGWVTIVTTVETADRTVTFVDSRQVA
jgi:hypothetical protein